MPFFVEGEDPRGPAPGRTPLGEGQQQADPFATPQVVDPLGPAWRLNNPMGSVINALQSRSPDARLDPTWNPSTILRPTDNLDNHIGDVNEAQTRAKMAQTDREEKDKQDLAASGFAGTVTSLAMGLTDPTMYIPFLGGAEAVRAGVGVIGTAARTAALGALQTTTSELALHASQQTRTWQESAGNIASGTLLMGLMGAGASAFMSRAEQAAASKSFDALRRDFSPALPTRAEFALTGDPAIDAVLQSPVTKGVIDNPVINREHDVPYGAGGSVPLADPTVYIDRHFPTQMTVNGVTFDPAEPFAIHENVEQHTMGLLIKGGMSEAEAYRVAHFEYAEKAEGAWYRAHGIDQAAAEAQYKPFLDQIQHEAPENPPSNLYTKPYPHDDVHLPQHETTTEALPSQGEIARARDIVMKWADEQGRLPPANDNASLGMFGGMQAVGAAASDTRQMQLKPFAPGRLGTAISTVSAKVNPLLRLFTSKSLSARRAAGDLADAGGLVFEEAKHGITPSRGGAPIDLASRQQQNHLLMLNNDILKEAWKAHYYPQGAPAFGEARAALDTRLGRANGRLDYAQFKAAVTEAHRNGDVHEIPEVQQAAQAVRQKVIDPLKKALQETIGLDGKPMLGEELAPPKGDKSFFFRIPNKENIAARWNDYKARITNWLEREQTVKRGAQERLSRLQTELEASREKIAGHEAAGRAEELGIETARHNDIRTQIEKEIADWQGKTTQEAKAALKARGEAEAGRSAKVEAGTYQGKGERLTSADKSVDKAVSDILESDRDLPRQELEKRAEEILNRHLATVDGRLPYDMASGGPAMGVNNERQQVRGSLNERRFAIPSKELPGFWHDDHEHVMAASLRTLIPDMMLTRRFGDVEMTEAFKRLNEDYDRLKAGAKGAKELNKLEAERQATARDLAATRDRVRSTYGWSPDPMMRNAARVFRTFGNINSGTSLGSSIWNRMTDIVQPIGRYGMLNVFRDAYLPFLASLSGMSKVAGAARTEMKAMAVGIDGMMGQMAHTFADVLGHGMGGNRFERGAAVSARIAMDLTGHSYWTDIFKTLGAHAASQSFLRAAEKVAGETASEKEIEMLAQAGIDPQMAKRIWAAYSDGGGEVIDGAHITNTAAWKDQEARSAFTNAMLHEANINVITPGAEKPLFMSKSVGGMLLQFKSFAFAATQRIMLAQLQQMDARTLQGFVAMMGMGMLSYRIYTLLAGQEVSDRPQDWVKEAVTRSAMFGWITDANELQAKVFSGKTDMWRAIGADRPLTRYQNRTALSDLLGPTYSHIEAMKDVIGEASRGTWSANDTHKLRQQLFLQNWFPIRRLLDQVEDHVNNAFGIQPRNRNPTQWPAQ